MLIMISGKSLRGILVLSSALVYEEITALWYVINYYLSQNSCITCYLLISKYGITF